MTGASLSPVNIFHPDFKDIYQEASMHVRLGARGTSGESEERVVDYILVGSDAEIIRELLFLLASKDTSSMNHSFFSP